MQQTESKLFAYLQSHQEDMIDDLIALVKAQSPSTDKKVVTNVPMSSLRSSKKGSPFRYAVFTKPMSVTSSFCRWNPNPPI